MKAITYQKQSDSFTLVEQDQPQPSGFDVLVKVEAVGLNPVDAKINGWHGMVPDMDDEFVGGLDIAGEIVATGDQVQGFQVGDNVLCHGDMRRTHGGFAEYSIQDSRILVAMPGDDCIAAAAMPCAGWTAWRALHDKLNIRQRRSIFIAGGSGGVGSFAIQLAKAAGVETIIATASAANHPYLYQLGVTHALDYRQSDIQSQVMAISPSGVDVALDCVGGDNAALCAAVLGFEGQMVELVDTLNPQHYPGAFMQGLSFHQLSLGSGHVNGDEGKQTLTRAGNAFSLLYSQGDIQLPKVKVITLEQIPDSLKEIRQQRTVGKIVAKLT